MKQDAHFSQYYDALYILFHTELRISEFAGLTVAAVDMENRKIMIDHQLLRERYRNYYIFLKKYPVSSAEMPGGQSDYH